jgi:hypothetical protein
MLARLIFLVALYLGLDVANPMMPGALAFSAEESVEVKLADRLRSHDVASVSARATERLKPDAEVRRPQPVVRTAVVSRPHARPRLRLPARSAAISPEDD